jgi:hypothetical protein
MLTRRDYWFDHQIAPRAIGAIDLPSGQNSDGNVNRRDVLDARLSRKSWAYG